MWVWLKRLLLALGASLILAQLVRPSRNNPPIDPNLEIQASTAVDSAMTAILERSCNDCHSSRTVWPWYSQLAPVSWFLVYDVREGRGDLNLSEWGAYDAQRRNKLLTEICKEVTEGEMPGLPYSVLHPNAKLSAEDVRAICQWTESARQGAPVRRNEQ